MLTRSWCALAASTLAVAGCTVGPNFSRQDVRTSASFVNADAATTQPATTVVQQELSMWWMYLNDRLLIELMDELAAGTPALREAEARVREARALTNVSIADLLPSADYFTGYRYERGSAGVGAPAREGNLFDAGFDASWEIDIFGGIRRSIEAARADLYAAELSRQDVLLTLQSELARTYVTLRGTQSRLAVVRENIALQADTLGLIESRFAAGLTSELDVAQARTQLATTRAELPPLHAGEAVAIYRIAVLLGRPPAELVSRLTRAADLPSDPGVPALGLAAELIARRPDLRAAEQRIRAANARIGVAVADLYPKFSITGSFGLQNEEFKDVPSEPSFFWRVGPAMRWRIFDGGRIRSNIRAASARERVAFAQFEQAVLLALEEVDASLAQYRQAQARAAALREAEEAGALGVRLARAQYAAGLVDFRAVLEAQRAVLIAQDQRIASEQDTLTQLVRLYKALGGGWTPEVILPQATDSADGSAARARAQPDAPRLGTHRGLG